MQCTEKYLSIRNGLRGKRKATMTYCDWCKRSFEIDEWFAVAWPEVKQEGPKRNWALCHDCADLAQWKVAANYNTIQSRH